MAKLSVIIVSYNGLNLLTDCLNSIRKYNDIGNNLEVIVSDNSPDFQVVDSVKSNFPEVKAIHNPQNGGFGYGNNRGVELSTSEYLLFLNPDTLLTEPIFQYAIEKFEQDNKLAIFGFRQFSKDRSTHYSYYLMDEVSLLDNLKQKKYLNNDIYIDGKMFIAGSEMFMRKDVFVKIGGFDENLFMFYEESDILRRVKGLNEGYYTAFFPEKSIVHLVGGTRKGEVNTDFNSTKRVLQSMKYYAEKHNLNFKMMVRKFRHATYFRKLKYQISCNKKQVEEFNKIIEYTKKI